MRITLSLVLTVGLGFGLAQPAWAQTKQNAWQRLTGVFKSKNQKEDAKKELKVEVRVSPPTTAQEGRGVVFVEEPRTPTPQGTGWAKTGKPPVISSGPAGQGISVPVTPPPAVPSPAAAPPLQMSQPKLVDSTTPVTQPKFVASPIASTPSSQPKIVESGPAVSPPKAIAPPVTAIPVTGTPVTVAPPMTATPVSYPKTVTTPSTQPQRAVLPAAPAKNAKAPVAGRDVSRLTRQVSQACPKARNVKLIFTSATEVTVEMDATTVEECQRHAEQIFAIRDLDPYRVNLKFNVPQN